MSGFAALIEKNILHSVKALPLNCDQALGVIILGKSTDGGILYANTFYDDLHKVQDSLPVWGDYDFMTVAQLDSA